MPNFLCTACGIQHAASVTPPAHCRICQDPRQFVLPQGQQWIAAEALSLSRFNGFRKVAPDLFGIWTMPQFAIGQRALLVITPEGNVLWDCLSLLDGATIDIIRALGGIRAIAISHPHFYSAMASWGRAFECPVLAHEADREWVAEPDPCIEFWSGETRQILPGLTLHRLGGHFPGSSVLHWSDRRRLLTGDTILVATDRMHVTFMWSYPNYVPLPATEAQRIAERLDALQFEAIHSAFWERGDIEDDGKAAVRRSIARHVHGPQA